MQRLRILLDASCLSDGRAGAGIGRYAREVIAALSARDDLEVEAAVPAGPPHSESRPGRFLHAHPAVLRAARRFRPHLVHGLGGEPVLGFPLSRQVVTVHDVEMWRDAVPPGPRGAALRFYGRAILGLYRRSAAIIAVSSTTAEEAIVTLGLDATRVHVVAHGVSSHFSAAAAPDDRAFRKAHGLAGTYVVWSGSLRRHDPRKGLDTLLDGMGLLGGGVALAMAGAPGDEAIRVARRGEWLGVPLVRCGPLPDEQLSALYRGAVALAMPSLHEGFGLPMLEAMACGTPVVATTAGNLPDLGEGAALFVTPRDAVALASALRSLLDDPAAARRARRAGQARAAAFTWARTAELTAAIYLEAVRTA